MTNVCSTWLIESGLACDLHSLNQSTAKLEPKIRSHHPPAFEEVLRKSEKREREREREIYIYIYISSYLGELGSIV